MILNRIRTLDYTTVVDGNNGEEQLVIVSSPTEGAMNLLVIQASATGQIRVLLNAASNGDDPFSDIAGEPAVPFKDVSHRLRLAIAHWDTKTEFGENTNGNVDAIIAAFNQHNAMPADADPYDLDIDYETPKEPDSPLYQDFLKANAAREFVKFKKKRPE